MPQWPLLSIPLSCRVPFVNATKSAEPSMSPSPQVFDVAKMPPSLRCLRVHPRGTSDWRRTKSLIKEFLLQRYFSKEVRGGPQVLESDIVQACRTLLDERQNINVWRFFQAINGRRDITERLKKLQCRTLVFVGDNSPFHSEAIHMTSKLDKRYSALVEVQACGSMVTEEQPHAMLVPMEYFMGYGLYRPSQLSTSPRSLLSPSCICPELLSPESMGLKLKPIKTRISHQV